VVVSHPNLNLVSAQIGHSACQGPSDLVARKGLVGIAVFHFIFAYSPTCQPHEDDGVDDVFVTVRP
jgi:hypothetical protein